MPSIFDLPTPGPPPTREELVAASVASTIAYSPQVAQGMCDLVNTAFLAVWGGENPHRIPYDEMIPGLGAHGEEAFRSHGTFLTKLAEMNVGITFVPFDPRFPKPDLPRFGVFVPHPVWTHTYPGDGTVSVSAPELLWGVGSRIQSGDVVYQITERRPTGYSYTVEPAEWSDPATWETGTTEGAADPYLLTWAAATRDAPQPPLPQSVEEVELTSAFDTTDGQPAATEN